MKIIACKPNSIDVKMVTSERLHEVKVDVQLKFEIAVRELKKETTRLNRKNIELCGRVGKLEACLKKASGGPDISHTRVNFIGCLFGKQVDRAKFFNE